MAQDEEQESGGGCVAGIVGLCYWAMLAASTIGPGTITLMSKGGAEFGLRLCWTIPIASLIAYCLQEAGARLQILQQTSFGGAMRIHFQPQSDDQVPIAANIDAELDSLPVVTADGAEDGPIVGLASPATAAVLSGDSLPTPKISIAMALMVVVANTFLEIAQFAGLMAAVKYYAGDPVTVRLAVSIMLAITVALILFKGNVDKISQGLGLVVVVMTVTFTISAMQTGFELGELVTGFLPQLPPASASGSPSAPQALGMIATTALPFNVFLASILAEGKTMSETRTGVGFSTVVTAVLSLLVVIVGTGIDLSDGSDFSLSKLTKHIGVSSGPASEFMFVGGLFAASLSSALTVALGAAIACQSLLSTGPADESWAPDSKSYRGIVAFQLVLSCVCVGLGINTVSLIMLSQVVGGVLLPTVSFCLLVCMNSPRLAELRRARAGKTSGRQTRRLNILLVFTCTATCFLAFTAVVPIVTADGVTGTPLYVISFLAAMVMLACSIRVVRAQRREDRNKALSDSQQEVPCESERNRAGSIARMEYARRVVLAHQQDDDTTILKQFDPSTSEHERCRSGSLARMEAARMKVLADFREEDNHDNL